LAQSVKEMPRVSTNQAGDFVPGPVGYSDRSLRTTSTRDAFLQHARQQMHRRRADGQTHAELARPRAHRERQHAGHAHRRRDQRQAELLFERLDNRGSRLLARFGSGQDGSPNRG
jgi:hypothetical protein